MHTHMNMHVPWCCKSSHALQRCSFFVNVNSINIHLNLAGLQTVKGIPHTHSERKLFICAHLWHNFRKKTLSAQLIDWGLTSP